MNLQTLPLSELNPAKYNPRKDLTPDDPEYQKLKKSILEFDLVEPIVWNKKTKNVVGGHQRLKILKELKRQKTKVVVVDLDERKEAALNLALNKISGFWDYPKLKDLIVEIDAGDFDIEITGFDQLELNDIFGFQGENANILGEENEAGDNEKNPIIKIDCPPGVWLDSKEKIIIEIQKFCDLYGMTVSFPQEAKKTKKQRF